VIRLEKRLETPWWLSILVPVLSLAAALAVAGVVIAASGNDPVDTYSRIVDRAVTSNGAFSATLAAATPLLFTGLCAAVAFRMGVFNIGGEGQFIAATVGASGVALALGDSWGSATVVPMLVVGALVGAAVAAVPGVLKAYFSTNEIITSLMMNYLALNLVNYLILNSDSYWRDLSPLKASFPQGKRTPFGADWMPIELGSLSVPLGFAIGIGVAAVVWVLYRRTRFGFEVSVIGDSPPAARYAGMRDRRKVVSVMALSGAMAGIGGASNIGDFNHVLDPKNLSRANYGYTGIVVAALARLNPLAVVVVSIVLGGIANAGRALQGPDFPAGLVGTIQGLILFFALGGEVLARYRIRRRTPATRAATAS
jgi:simple sugar transport system permease protein